MRGRNVSKLWAFIRKKIRKQKAANSTAFAVWIVQIPLNKKKKLSQQLNPFKYSWQASIQSGRLSRTFSVYHHALAGKFPHVWDRPQVLFSGHGTEATDTDVKAREKSTVNLFATCQLCSVGGSRIVVFSLFSLNLVYSVLCNAAVSSHRNCLNVALFLDTFWICVRGQRGFSTELSWFLHDHKTPIKGEWTEIF